MLLAAEGVTILWVRELLTPHVFIGMVLVPPVLLKVARTGWRFARYYRGAPAYRRKGPGAGPRQWLIAASLVVGTILGFLLLSHVGHWLALSPGG